MSQKEDVAQTTHHGFSVAAHNRAMDILYDAAPSQEEIESLIELAHVAHWHWQQRTDRTIQNTSVAQWLLARAYCANGFGGRALYYAELSLATIKDSDLLPSFFGYSYEALARAYLLLGSTDKSATHLKTAYEIAETVPNARAKEYLLDQINRIEPA